MCAFCCVCVCVCVCESVSTLFVSSSERNHAKPITTNSVSLSPYVCNWVGSRFHFSQLLGQSVKTGTTITQLSACSVHSLTTTCVILSPSIAVIKGERLRGYPSVGPALHQSNSVPAVFDRTVLLWKTQQEAALVWPLQPIHQVQCECTVLILWRNVHVWSFNMVTNVLNFW